MNATTATALLADGHWHGGPWFLLFPLIWLLFLVFVFATLRRTAWRRGWRGPHGPWANGGSQASPLAVLGSGTRAGRSTRTSTGPGRRR